MASPLIAYSGFPSYCCDCFHSSGSASTRKPDQVASVNSIRLIFPVSRSRRVTLLLTRARCTDACTGSISSQTPTSRYTVPSSRITDIRGPGATRSEFQTPLSPVSLHCSQPGLSFGSFLLARGSVTVEEENRLMSTFPRAANVRNAPTTLPRPVGI